MAQRPTHVPKFGSWDADHRLPYTDLFDHAPAGGGGGMINSNDPSENPDAFPFDINKMDQPSRVDSVNRDEAMPRSRPPRHQKRASREDAEFWQARHEPRVSREEGNIGKQSGPPVVSSSMEPPVVKAGGELPTGRPVAESTAQRLSVRPSDGGQRRGQPPVTNRENGVFERLGGESPYRNPGPGQSPLNPQVYQGRLGRKLGSASPAWDRRASEGGAGYMPGTPGRVRSDKGALLPKFGEWDANNPASGDGFTVIFNKAREERKTGGAITIPPMQADSPLQYGTDGDGHKQAASDQENSILGYLCSCFRPTTK